MATAIINYGLGNIRSVANAIETLNHEAVIADRPGMLESAERVILPGVGAFGDGMRSLSEGGWVDALEHNILKVGKPFLGLCLGMQLLASNGTEHGIHKGLGWIRGTVDRLRSTDDLRIPHIGWNDVRFVRRDGLYAGQDESSVFYFVHSYVLQPEDPKVVSGVCSYGEEFVASIECQNIFGTQFHPEKSQKAGLAVLKRFLDLEA
jgi:glutamine amidotransferase